MVANANGGAMRKIGGSAVCLTVVLTASSILFAHDGKHPDRVFLNIEISEVITALCLVVGLGVYITGLRKLWRAAGLGRAISMCSAGLFLAGWASLAMALVGPAHTLSELLFSAHMTQHEILMLISAPLMILGRSQIAAVWALPETSRRAIIPVIHSRPVQGTWRFISNGFVALLLHALALWVWHIPFLFQTTLTSDLVHALQHISFFGTALLFWWAITTNSRDWKTSSVGVLYLFVTSLQSGILGAFLTFTNTLWFPVYRNSTAAWGLTPLEDQQLGGLIMWVPAGLVYIAAGLIMFSRMLDGSEKRAFSYDRDVAAPQTTANL